MANDSRVLGKTDRRAAQQKGAPFHPQPKPHTKAGMHANKMAVRGLPALHWRRPWQTNLAIRPRCVPPREALKG